MKTTRAITVIASALLTLLPMPSARAAATPLAPATGTTTLVSVASDGTQANAGSYDPAMSADGRYVAFQSRATNLVGTLATGYHIYVRDRGAGTTVRASVASDGTPGNATSGDAAISADGRHVAYLSYATNLVSDDTEGHKDVFVHDTHTGQTSRISEATDGTEANDWSSFPVGLSADGRYVVFDSAASNLVAGDTNNMVDVFLRDRNTDADGAFDEPGAVSTIRVSINSDGEEANFGASSPSISADGRYVAFLSQATNLVPEHTDFSRQLYVHTVETGENTLVSVASDGTLADQGAANPRLSADGRYVAFQSTSTNLVPGAISGNQIYLHDIETGETTLVSVASDGTPQASGSVCTLYAVSAYGRYVAFDSTAGNLVPDDKNGKWDIFLHDTDTGKTTRVSIAWDGAEGNWHSDRGGALSAHARYVAFGSEATNLVPNDATYASDIFLRDRKTPPQTKLAINYPDGGPGSTFTISGSGFPVFGTASIAVNGHELGTSPVDATGQFSLLLTTAGADEGIYIVTATVNPTASARLVLDAEQPVRPQEDTGTAFAVPSGIAFTEQVFLPIVRRASP